MWFRSHILPYCVLAPVLRDSVHVVCPYRLCTYEGDVSGSYIIADGKFELIMSDRKNGSKICLAEAMKDNMDQGVSLEKTCKLNHLLCLISLTTEYLKINQCDALDHVQLTCWCLTDLSHTHVQQHLT